MADNQNAQRAKCFSFYSYKGGSGRSTTCVNTVLHLIQELKADPNHPLLLVDSDLESAGLTYFFDCEKKFSSLSINTTMLLRSNTALFSEDTAPWVMGDISSFPTKTVSKDVIGDLTNMGEEDADILLRDIPIYRPESKVLNSIVKSYVLCKKYEQSRSDDQTSRVNVFRQIRLSDRDIMINDDYSIDKLLTNLRTIQNKKNILSQEELIKKKRESLVRFLPATQFVDISDYFQCAPGTVRFLGVVLNYQDEQILRNDATNVIKKLLSRCGAAGYRAVVFDSSAGVQSTAHALHAVSDVMVYCLRPSQQFIKGTAKQLDNYRSSLHRHKEELKQERSYYTREDSTNAEKKPIIILPTVVPNNDEYAALRDDSFEEIRMRLLPDSYRELIDDTFCTLQTALNEIEYFKWREQILGVPDIHKKTNKVASVVNQFADEKGVLSQQDTASAYRVYQLLATRLLQNS